MVVVVVMIAASDTTATRENESEREAKETAVHCLPLHSSRSRGALEKQAMRKNAKLHMHVFACDFVRRWHGGACVLARTERRCALGAVRASDCDKTRRAGRGM